MSSRWEDLQCKNHFATVCKQNLYASNIGPYKNKPNKYGRPNKYGKKGQDNMVGHSDETDFETELFKIETVNLTKPRVGPSDKDTLAIKKQWITEHLFVNKNKAHSSIKCQLDTGASCGIIRKNDLLRLTKNGVESSVRESETLLKCYGGELIKPLGKVFLNCRVNNNHHNLSFQEVDTQRYQKPLISADKCSLLKLFYVNAKL